MKNKEDNFYRHTDRVLSDQDFNTCVRYANFISGFFKRHGIENWELCEVKARWSEVKSESDNVNPDHYKVGGIETFDILRAKLSPTQLAGFCKGNVIKYITRADNKGKVEDLKKARWYLDKLIEELDDQATS